MNRIKKILLSEYVFIALLFTIGFIVRIKNVASKSLVNDEFWTIYFSSPKHIYTFGEMLSVISTKFADVLPLYPAIMRIWIYIFGDSELVLRLPSILFGSISLVLFYILTKKLFSKKIAIISAIVLVNLPVHIYYSQLARAYSLFFLLSIISMIFFIKISGKHRHFDIMAYIFSTTLLIYCHHFGLFIVLAQIIHAAYIMKRPKLWVCIYLCISLLYAPWIPPFIHELSYLSVSNPWIQRVSVWSGFVSQLQFFSPYFNSLPIKWIFSLVVLVGFGDLFRKKKIKEFYLLVLWFLVPIIAPLILSQFIRPIFVNRYAYVSLVPFIIAFSLGLLRVIKNKYILACFIAFIFLFPFQLDPYAPTEIENWKSAIGAISCKNNVVCTPTMVYPETVATYIAVDYYINGHLTRLSSSEVSSQCPKKIYLLSRYINPPIIPHCDYSRQNMNSKTAPFIFKNELRSE